MTGISIAQFNLQELGSIEDTLLIDDQQKPATIPMLVGKNATFP